MAKKILLGVLVLALAAAFSMPAMAQDAGTARGNLGGIVYDATNSVVPGAAVTITGPIGSKTDSTGEQGTFLFSTLIPGFYSVKVSKQGFKVAEVKSVEVLINKTSSIQVNLETGELSQVVEVSSASLTVDTSTASVNADLADTFYNKIPIQRGVSSLFYLSPGVVSGLLTGSNNPGVSGASGLENLYVADGVSITDPAFGGLGVWSRSYGALGSGITLSFVKEVQVKTGGFEPQYGHASGGIVQIVTKSGGTQTHGVAAGYFQWQGIDALPANQDDFGVTNLIGRRLQAAAYEADLELGGYVPLGSLKDKLFYYGNYSPNWAHDYEAPAVGSGLFTIYNGQVDRRTNSYDYAGKLTYKISNSQTIETSIFGDPAHTNHVPWSTLNATDTSVNSKWDFGTRNWAVRYDGSFGKGILIDGAFTWSWNHFSEFPAQDFRQVVDQTQILAGQAGTFNGIGFGFLEPYDGNTRSIQFDVSKSYHFGGQHTFSFGYNWQYPIYDDITVESGGKYTIPDANATGGNPGYLTNPLQPAGKQADAALILILAANATNVTPAAGGSFNPLDPGPTSCTLCPYESIPGFANPQQVVLQSVRGRFDGGTTVSSGKYHAAYANDSWQIGTHVTLNLGFRWEQQRLTGNVSSKVFTNMWSPRIGIIVDPKGDRKSKIYANFGRYGFVLPLDQAVRSLSNEDDFFNAYWAPASTTTGCPAGTPAGASCILTTAGGTPDYANLNVTDSAHLLNKAVVACPAGYAAGTVCGGVSRSPHVAASGGEPFQAGIKFEYTDEFVVGAEHQFRGGIVASARYIDRRLKRVIEDEGGISVEQFNALANNGGGLNYFIGNPSGSSDIFANPNEQPFGGSGPCAGSSNGLTTSNCTPLDEGGFVAAFNNLVTTPTAGNAALLEAQGYPSACIDSHFQPTPYTTLDTANTFGTVLGSACFPAVNTSTWTDTAGNLLPDCTSQAEANTPGACAAFGGEFYPDGKPDTYKDPKREYEAVEFEVNKSFSHNWALVANWRISQLRGNYEGAFRNDNNQADPGISSLFDLTQGMFGLIGQQQGIGYLNTDRFQVVNVYATYVLDKSKLKGMVFGGGLRIASGVPLTTLAAQQAYQNAGEVPIFGRGDLGRAPVTGTIDAHLEYPWKVNDRMTLKFGFDAFNIANTKRQTLLNQNVDQGFGLVNTDFTKPWLHFFVPAFNSRAIVKLEF